MLDVAQAVCGGGLLSELEFQIEEWKEGRERRREGSSEHLVGPGCCWRMAECRVCLLGIKESRSVRSLRSSAAGLRSCRCGGTSSLSSLSALEGTPSVSRIGPLLYGSRDEGMGPRGTVSGSVGLAPSRFAETKTPRTNPVVPANARSRVKTVRERSRVRLMVGWGEEGRCSSTSLSGTL